MSHLEEWARLIAKQLKSEAELVGVQAKSELYQDAARETFVRVVLEPFLPGSYAISSGRVIDASGNISSPQDIVIYRKNYPQFNMPGSHDVFIYESVLATIQVCSKLVRKTFFTALDQCASMATLDPVIDPETHKILAEKMKLRLDAQQQYVHADPLTTGRFNLIGRPQTFVYAFSGFQTSEKQLTDNLNKWIDHYHQDNAALQLMSLPSVIATQGCFAWRNTAPFFINDQALLGVGNDHAPLRLMILQLMQSLNRRLQNTSDGYGIKSSITPYLNQFERPTFISNVGVADNPGVRKVVETAEEPVESAIETAARLAVSQDAATADKRRGNGSAAKLKSLEPEPAATKDAAVTKDPVAAKDYAVTKDPIVTKEKQKKPISTPSAAPVEAPVAAATDTSQGKQSELNKPPEVQPPPASPEPEPAKSNSDGPVIENLSKPLPARDNPAGEQAADGRTPPRPNPLSVLSGQDDKNVDEYEFIPLETTTTLPDQDDPAKGSTSSDLPAAGQVNNMAAPDDLPVLEDPDAVAAAKEQSKQEQTKKAAADESDFEETQEIVTDVKRFEVKQKDSEESSGEFLDTLVEKPEAEKKEESDSKPKKSQYVTESVLH